MTSSFGFKLPDISSTNYVDPADHTTQLDKNIQESNAAFSSYVEGRIKTNNEMLKIKEKKENQLLQLTATGMMFYEWNKKRIASDQLYDDFHGLNKDIEVRMAEDANVKAFNSVNQVTRDNATSDVNELIKTTTDAGEPLHPDEEQELTESVDNRPARVQLNDLTKMSPQMFLQSADKLQWRSKGDGQWKTINLAGSAEEWEQGWDVYAKWMFEQAYDITDNPRLIREILYPKLLELQNSERTKWITNKREAIKASRNLREESEYATELINSPSNDATPFYSLMRRSKGKYALGNGKYDWPAVRRYAAETTISLLDDKIITPLEATKILNSIPDTPDNLNSKNPKQFRDYWPLEARMIQAAITKANNDDVRNAIQAEKAAVDKYYLDTTKNWGDKPVTSEMVNVAVAESERLHGKASEHFLSILTEQEQDWKSLYEKVEERYYDGQQITFDDIRSIQDGDATNENFRQKAEKLVQRSENGLNTRGVASRNDFIESNVKKYSGVNYGKTDIKDPRVVTLTENAYALYNDTYSAARDAGQNHAAAKSKAEKEVIRALGAKELDTRVYVPEDLGVTQALSLSTKAIANDPSILDQQKPLPGEELAFEQAAKWYANPKGSPPVEYYRALVNAGITKGHPEGGDWKSLMDHRWRLSGGKIEPTQLQKDVKALRLDYKNQLEKNTPSDTLQVLEKDPDFFTKVLNNSKIRPDYNYIRQEGGQGPVETEKPLTEHSVGEVLELIQNDYDDFGIYGLSGLQVIDALEGMTWDINQPFNEEFQDKIMKSILRTKANRMNHTKGVDVSWNNLVNINDDAKVAYAEVSGATSPFLQLDSFSEELAMAAIDMLEPVA